MRNLSILFFLIVFNLFSKNIFAQLQLSWAKNYFPTGHNDDYLEDALIDNNGSIYLRGLLGVDTVDYIDMLIKLDSSGNEIWRISLDLFPGQPQNITGIIINNLNNIDVIGNINRITGTDIFLFEYDRNTGSKIDSAFYNFGSNDQSIDITKDNFGNILIAGTVGYSNDSGLYVSFDHSNLSSSSVILTDTGNVTLTNFLIRSSDLETRICATSYRPGGDQEISLYDIKSDSIYWCKKFSDSTNAALRLKDFEIGKNGFTVLFSDDFNAGNNDDNVLAIAVDSSGNELWRKNLTNGTYLSNEIITAKISKQNEVLVAYNVNDPNYFYTILECLDSAGNIRFRYVDTINYRSMYSLTFVYKDGAICINEDSTITFFYPHDNNFNGREDRVIVRLDSAGNILNKYRFSGEKYSRASKYNYSILLNDSVPGRIIFAGTVYNAGKYNDLSVVSYDSSLDVRYWEKNIDNNSLSIGQFNDVARDHAGNAFVCGTVYQDSTNNDIIFSKYDPAGILQWSKYFNGLSNEDDYGDHIIVDGNDDIIVSGKLTDSAYYKCTQRIYKYDTNGNLLWTQGFQNAYVGFFGYFQNANDYFQIRNLAIDDNNDIYVTYSDSDVIMKPVTIKLDGQTGNIKFNCNTTGISAGSCSRIISVDSNHNVTIAGEMNIRSQNYNIAFISRIDSTGSQQWVTNFSTQSSHIYDLKTGASGNSFVTGFVPGSSSNYPLKIVSYDSSGNLRWSNNLVSLWAYNYSEDVLYLALDSYENIYLTAWIENPPDTKLFLYKFNSSGQQLWVDSMFYNYDEIGKPSGITINSAGEILISVNYYNDFSGRFTDAGVLKFEPFGLLSGSLFFNDTNNLHNVSIAFTSGSNGDIFLCGMNMYKYNSSLKPSNFPLLVKFSDFTLDVQYSSESNNQIKFFPNPTIGELNISGLDKFSGCSSIDILNLQGEIVFHENSDNLNNRNTQKIQVSLNSGTYFLSVSDKSHTERKSFVVVK